MHYIAYLSIDDLYCRTVTSQRPQIIHYEGRVLDRNDLASKAGIYRGMSLAEAKTILGGNGDINAWHEEPYREARERWLNVLAEYSDVIEPVQQHCAFVDLSQHPNPTDLLQVALREIANRCGFTGRVGVARCRWIAQVACWYGGETLEGLYAPRDYIASTPIDRMISVEPAHRVRLKFLGYSKIGDVADVPPEILKKQFGPAAFDIRRAALGTGDHHVSAEYPEASIGARFNYAGAPDTEEQFYQGVDEVSKLAAKKLKEQELFARDVEVFLEDEECNVVRHARTFTKPIGALKELKTAVRLTVGDTPDYPVQGIRVRLPHLENPKYLQLELKGNRALNERKLSAESALRCVTTVFGDNAVKTAAEVTSDRRQRVLGAWKDARGWY